MTGRRPTDATFFSKRPYVTDFFPPDVVRPAVNGRCHDFDTLAHRAVTWGRWHDHERYDVASPMDDEAEVAGLAVAFR